MKPIKPTNHNSMTTLVIVESPAKCGKIQGFLGAGYVVKATMGHIRALRPSLDALGMNADWEPQYEELSSKKDAISKLRTAAKAATRVLLASDDDREGEAISWHVCFLLKLNPVTTQRIVFHEITKPAILHAVANPKLLDMNKVNAQQARAMLDLLVGFTISKVLWSKVAPKLSAGRCQTPALKLVAERDALVENHVATSYYTMEGNFQPKAPTVATGSVASLAAHVDTQYPTETPCLEYLNSVKHNTTAKIVDVKHTVSSSAPPKPHITSTLQQEASSAHGLSPKTTMMAAQKLYEAGHITYMRTDNAVISEEAAATLRALVQERYGDEYVGSVGDSLKPKITKTIKTTKTTKKPTVTVAATVTIAEPQAAHEAIRPTHPEATLSLDDPVQKKVYALIWKRAVGSVMAPSKTDIRKILVVCEANTAVQWSLTQTKIQFAGWRILDMNKESHEKDVQLWNAYTAVAVIGALLVWSLLAAVQNYTKPKGRFTEASLVAELETKGIGRPSTFANLISTIVDRDYVEKTNVEGVIQTTHQYSIKPGGAWPPTHTTEEHKTGAEKNKLRATALGRSVADYLYRDFNDLFAYTFTAAMEAQLDDVSKGTLPWKSVLTTTWNTYKDRYEGATKGGAKASAAARSRQLAEGIKVVLSKKGPLFVKEDTVTTVTTVTTGTTVKAKGKKATFAPLKPGMSFDTVTEADAIAAFSAAATAIAGTQLGTHDGKPIVKKTGRYGAYVEWGSIKIPFKIDDTLPQLVERLTAKATAAETPAYTRIVGDFTIRSGPYGLYFFKHALKRVTFVKLPAGVDSATVTASDLATHYSNGLKRKTATGYKKKAKSDAEPDK